MASMKGGKLKRTLLEIYALAVCFVTLTCFVVCLGVGVYDLVQITKPEFTLSSYKYEEHQSNDAFLRSWPKDKEIPNAEKVTELRLESYQRALRSEQREAVQSLTQIAIIILIDIVVFVFHWLMARRARASDNAI